MQSLQDAVDRAAEHTGFSGVVRADRASGQAFCMAYGLADRGHEVPNTTETQFAIASGSKSLTALVVTSLVERGTLELRTTARSLLGNDLPLVADDVTVEHLLAHRSGIGDYLDEDAVDDIRDYVMPVPVHELATTEQFLRVLDGHETVFPTGERFGYNNGGYVLLALLAERASGVEFHDLVRTLVCEPAGMSDTAFLRSDELPGRAALGYLSMDGLRTNVFHLPVRGNGDGGIYSTAADLSSFWDALFAGRIVSPELLAEMVRPRSDWPEESRRYGLGFHLHATSEEVWLEGYDAGVSCASVHQPSSSITFTVISNWSEGAWPIIRLLRDRFGN
ncbi:serine hydrolase [Terrabacter sp. MAHUQ-38]|jgi:CubicO group peptidase (beta-lactamase class C family)|uniref:serine hydrolase domain-containing protein n=1 Tax=unclassified Terrabacter TaxID=2630222 RepID=UPI00165D4E17|nr:serine hydrolase domain-containing protein [Terrabacter sp. MAHUQ-38]MBC9823602.1 beta-lactamase family protein [Terrabacter sp. MAHUQ-38]